MKGAQMKRALLAAVLLLMALPGIVGAHTGSISASQDCETGNTVTAHLDANVAEGATWTVTVNGTEADSGTGPADLGPYDAGFKAGSASLDIVYQQEHNTYIVEYGDVEPCEQPTPTPQPTPCNPRAGGDCATPTPTVPDSGGGPTPQPTLPQTYTRLVAVEHSDGFIPFWAAVILILAGLVGGWATLRRIR